MVDQIVQTTGVGVCVPNATEGDILHAHSSMATPT